jgi:hypothetical protein
MAHPELLFRYNDSSTGVVGEIKKKQKQINRGGVPFLALARLTILLKDSLVYSATISLAGISNPR